MAACWRSLQQQPSINLTVIAFQAHTATAFADDLMQGIPSRLLTPAERQNAQLIKQTVLAANPDIIVLCGWLHKPYRQLAADPDLHPVKFVMGMDTPWQGTLKQYLAPFALRSYLSRIDRVVVTGDRSWHYAHHLGIAPDTIHRGLYGIDYATWANLYTARTQNPWPRRFLFVGRYVSVKAVDVLVAAYQQYRTQVSDPWTLVCCGKGNMESLLESQPGIENRGFVQPSDMRELWQNAGAFLLPSRFDPWPLALIEAAAAGLPIICTNACGSAVEVVRPWYNGLVIDEDNLPALSNALLTLHHHHADLPQWGARSQHLAAPYSAEIWTQRWMALFASLDLPSSRSSLQPETNMPLALKLNG
jgi:glycosyltransferase involved in cell wall biosynthesis